MNSSNVMIQSGFSGAWLPNPSASGFTDELVKYNPKITELRPWQGECAFDLIASDKPNKMIIAPTGSGKSIAINYLISHMLYTNAAKKIIVSVPQKAIGGGFTANDMLFPMDTEGNNLFEFSIKHDYCSGYISVDSKTDAVISFLEDNHALTNSDKILVCVNNTLVNVYARLKEQGRLHLLEDAAIWFDEAHHIQTENDEVANRLGELVLHCLRTGVPVNVVTATSFRGDRLSIIPRDYTDTFARFTLPYDRHFTEHCNGMAFTYDFVLHTGDWYEGFSQILKDHGDEDRKTIIFIPHPNTRAFKTAADCKWECRDDVLALIKGSSLSAAEQVEDAEGVLTLNRAGRQIRVVDLVSDIRRHDKVELLRGDRGDTVDYVLGINVPKEGFDWPCANREFIVGPKNSLNELMQMMGRTFRGYPNKGADKEPVQIFHVLPWVDDSKVENTELRDALNDYLKAVYMSMIGESIMNPPSDVKIPTHKNADTVERQPNEVLEYTINALGGESHWEVFLKECVNACRITRTDNDGLSVRELNELVKRTIASVVTGDDRIDTFHEEIEALIFKAFMSRSFKLLPHLQAIREGFDLGVVDFDILEEVDSMYFMLWYTNGFCNAGTFQALRKRLGDRKSLEEHVELCRLHNYTSTAYEANFRKHIGDGYYSDPSVAFDKPWSYFTGNDIYSRERKSLEEHVQLFTLAKYTAKDYRENFHKHVNEGFYSDPAAIFDKPWSYFTGNDIFSRERKSLEEHVALIRKHKYSARSYPLHSHKHISDGYYREPSVAFGKPWPYFTGNDLLSKERRSLEEHVQLFKDNAYASAGYADNFHKHQKDGYYRNPDRVFGKPISFFTGNTEMNMERRTLEEHVELIRSNQYTRTMYNANFRERHQADGYHSAPVRVFSKPWSYFSKNDSKTKERRTLEEHVEMIRANAYSHARYVKNFRERHQADGYHSAPVRFFGKPWSYFSGIEAS